MTEASEAPSISFIIPTYNASFHIKRCLSSIGYQRYPKDKIEIVIADGGSTDSTLDIAKHYDCRVLENPNRLAEYGVQIGILNAKGELVVVFAADNELISQDWATAAVRPFMRDKNIAAAWGRIAASEDSPGINKYFALIQNDPLSFFVNKNLKAYLKDKATLYVDDYCIFNVDSLRPLVWGANGLIYRRDLIRPIWDTPDYLGDNDAFQIMLERGFSKVAYFDRPFVYHHHVRKISDCIRKWRRNYVSHFLKRRKTRNLKWAFTSGFSLKLAIWIVYSAVPIFSFVHSIFLALRSRNKYWIYHSIASFIQVSVYAIATLVTLEGRRFLKERVLGALHS